MKAIYSLSVGKNASRNNEFCGYRCKEELLDALLLSSSISAKHFDKVELYCDTEAANLIEEDGREFPFEIIICLDSLSWVDEHLWAYSKVFVYSLQTEPFLHIDIDAILWDGIPEELSNMKFIFQQVEKLSSFFFYNKIFDEAKAMGLLPAEIRYKSKFALNTAVFACTDIAYLPLLQEYFNVVDNYISNVNGRIHQFTSNQAQCILFEQLFIANILTDAGLEYESDYDVILNDDYSEKWRKCRFTHMIVKSKREEKNVNRIKRALLNLDKIII